MYTSNYWNYNGINAISIAIKAPDFYNGKHYKKLAPLYWFLKDYKLNNYTELYTKRYTELVLDKLNPYEVFNELGENSVLLCWEKPGEFCHRRLVANWFKNTLNKEVLEWK